MSSRLMTWACQLCDLGFAISIKLLFLSLCLTVSICKIRWYCYYICYSEFVIKHFFIPTCIAEVSGFLICDTCSLISLVTPADSWWTEMQLLLSEPQIVSSVKNSNACLKGLLSVSQELIPRRFLSECLVHTINIMRTTYNSISLEGKAFPAISTSFKERSLILTNQ